MPHFNSDKFERLLNFVWDASNGAPGKEHCCERMSIAVKYRCGRCSDIWACGDCLVIYSPPFDEYGSIVHDGGASYVLLSYCPWCGARLPDSRRDRWFEALEKQGFNSPLEQEIPDEYKTGAWYKTGRG